jgi:hypothetical protein
VTVAAARVEVKIGVSASGNAAEVVEKTRKGLEGLDKGAKDVKGSVDAGAAGLENFAKAGKETASKGGAAFAGLAAVLGGSVVPEIAKAGQSLTAVGAAANLLPGPIGLAAIGIGGLALGAAALQRHFAEVAAQVQFLGDSSTRGLAESLGVSVSQAIKLQHGLADLPAALRPSVALLDTVRKRAESMGLDGAAAQNKLLDALDKGPAALKAYEREFGRLSAQAFELPDVAKRLGLSAEALGLAQKVGDEAQRATAAAERAANLERTRQALAATAAELERAAASASSRNLAAANEASVVAHERAATARVLVERAVEEANALQEVVERQRAAAAAETRRQETAATRAAEIGLLEAQAALQRSAGARALAQGVVLSERGAELARQMVALQADHALGLVSEVKFRQDVLGLQTAVARNYAAKVALAKQAAADRKAASDRERARIDAETAAELRLAKVRAETAAAGVLPTGVEALKRRALAIDEAAEVERATRAVNTARGRAAAILAVEAEFAARRRALAGEVAEVDQRLALETAAVVQSGNERSAALIQSAAAATSSAAKARAAVVIAALRAVGDEDQAELRELEGARAEFAEARAAIDARAVADLGALNAASDDYSTRERQRLAELGEAQARLDLFEAAIAERRKVRQRDRLASLIESSAGGPANLLRSMSAESAKTAEALQGVAAGAAVVARNWGDLGKAAPGAISAVGSVAVAFVDGEREKAAVLAVMEAAAAIAAAAVEDYAGAAAHGAAAVLYGGIAAGAFGSRGGSSGAVSGGGGFSDSGGGGGRDGQTAQGSTTVININTPLVSRQEVAKGVSSGLRSLATTGYAKAPGA